jgi:hypothetical protein
MSERLLDFDPTTGLKTFHIYDPVTHETALRYEQDVEPLLDANKASQNEHHGPMGDLVHVASVPVAIQLKWFHEKGVAMWNPDHKQAVARLLDDPEYKYLKRLPITLGKTR